MAKSTITALNDQDKLQIMDAILEHSASCLYVKDLNLRYILVNRFALQCFGFSESDVIGKTDEEIFPKDYARSSRLSDQKVIDTRTTIREDNIATLATGIYHFHTVKTPLCNEDGKLFAICGIATDISEEKQAHSELQSYLEKLEGITTELMEARIQSEAASIAKNAFIANMSHELRTPLNGIIGNLSLILMDDLSPKQTKYITRIKASAQILLEIINQVLDFSKIAAGMLQLESIPIDLNKILLECEEITGAKAEEKGLLLEYILPNPPLPQVLGDPVRMKQIMVNLVGNSLKFTEKGSVIVSMKSLGESDKKLNIRISIEDTGIGIPEDKLNHLFEKFWQADVSNTRKYGGTGLGLAIVKEVVDQMKGTIEVTSQVGQGTTFAITIPFPLA
jgi:two-component system sensor histidine kinase/response regulator